MSYLKNLSSVVVVFGMSLVAKEVLGVDIQTTVDDFVSVEVAVNGSIELIKADESRVSLTIENGKSEDFKLDVKNGTLRLREARENRLWPSGRKLKVGGKVFYTKLERVVLSHSGTVLAAEVVQPKMNLTLNGSGTIEVNSLEADDLNLVLSGSGKIKIRQGRVGYIATVLRGSGNIEVSDLHAETNSVKMVGSGNFSSATSKTDNVDVDIVGSGNVRVHAVKALDVKIVGSGNVIYRGEPEIETRVIGSGRLRKN